MTADESGRPASDRLPRVEGPDYGGAPFSKACYSSNMLKRSSKEAFDEAAYRRQWLKEREWMEEAYPGLVRLFAEALANHDPIGAIADWGAPPSEHCPEAHDLVMAISGMRSEAEVARFLLDTFRWELRNHGDLIRPDRVEAAAGDIWRIWAGYTSHYPPPT